MSNNNLTLAIHAGHDRSVNATSTRSVPVRRTFSKFAALFIVASFAANSAAEDIPVVNVGGTKISLYGFLQLNAVYEDGANGGKNWTEIVTPNAQDGEGRILLNVNQTRIGFNLAGPQAEGGAEISGKFEADFGNSNDKLANGVGVANNSTPSKNYPSGFRIRQSYGQVKFSNIGLTLLLGQTGDLIAPLSPPSINQGGLKSDGELGNRRPQIRLTQAVGPVEIAVAATDDRGAAAPVIPAFQGSIKGKIPANWAGEKQNIELILSAHYATEENAAETEAPKTDSLPTSWSGVASLSLPVISIVNFSGEIFYGQNLQQYNNGTIKISRRTVPGRGTGIQSIGGWGAANVKLPLGFAVAGGYGVEAIDEDHKWVEGAPKKNSIIFANLKYNIAETAFVGFEYANLATDYAVAANEKAVDGKLNRFELVFNYTFK